MGVSIVAMEVQMVMSLDVAGEEIVGPGKVGMAWNVSNGTKATLDVTNAMRLVTIIMSVGDFSVTRFILV